MSAFVYVQLDLGLVLFWPITERVTKFGPINSFVTTGALEETCEKLLRCFVFLKQNSPMKCEGTF